MTDTAVFTPALSPGFDRARKLSRFTSILFALGFLVMLSVALSAIVFEFFPKTPSGVGFGIGLTNGLIVGFGDLHGWQAVGSMAGVELIVVPIVLALHHTRKLFSCFAKGEVFAAQPIAHIRWAGLSMTISFFSGIAAVYLLALSGQKQGLLGALRFYHFLNALPGVALRFESNIFTGIPIIIAAYVMEEARRIAADHAEIV